MKTDEIRVLEERILDHRIPASCRAQLENHSLSTSRGRQRGTALPKVTRTNDDTGEHRSPGAHHTALSCTVLSSRGITS